MNGSCRALSVQVVAVLALSGVASAQHVRVGGEFQVNAYTISSQDEPSVAADADRDLVVAWDGFGQDGSSNGIFARRFSSAGTPVAAEFLVNDYTVGSQFGASVAADADGDFVVAWESSGQDGSYAGVFARRFSSAGTPVAAEFQVNDYTITSQFGPSVAAHADGDFIVAWASKTQDGSYDGVFARRFSSAGAAQAAEFQVNTYTSSFQRYPSVAADTDGDFTVAWTSYTQDGSHDSIFARRFSSDGAPLSAEFQVNEYTIGAQDRPSVAADADGDGVVTWNSAGQDGLAAGIFARRFSSTGVSLTSEFQVNTHTAHAQRYASVSANADGDFVVAWQSYQDGSFYGVFARRFSSGGAPLAGEFQVNHYTSSVQDRPSVAADGKADFVVVWASLDQDGSAQGVFAQSFASPAVLDVDGNGLTDPLTDGLLVLRYLFGFTGGVLVTGAVGEGCNRCEAASIEAYLATLI